MSRDISKTVRMKLEHGKQKAGQVLTRYQTMRCEEIQVYVSK